MPLTPSADWYADPLGRFEKRYWDGARWTEHVTSNGAPSVDPPLAPPAPVSSRGDEVSGQQSRRPDVGPKPSEASVLSQQVLIVNQKLRLVGNKAEYAIFDQQGRQISIVRELSRGLLANAISIRPPQNRTRRLQVLDDHDNLVLALTRPANFAKSTVIVHDAGGSEIGRIVQKSLGVIGSVRFALESNGRAVGTMRAEGWNTWDFAVHDGTGSEVARITKTWAGWGKERFTKADNYVVEIHKPLQDPLRSLAVATALTVDVALKQGQQTRKTSRRSARRFE